MDKLNAFIGKFVADLGASVHAGMVVIGDRLGLYKALATRPMSPAELARATATDERYVREWLSSQAAGGYVHYDAGTGRFSLDEEQAMALAEEDSPAYIPGAFELALGSLKAVPRITDAFRSGTGLGWHEHDEDVFHGCERFFRPGYLANLVSTWIPALTGVVSRLEAGARVADVGCGQGASTILMAKAYPASRFVGFDYHEGSIEVARPPARPPPPPPPEPVSRIESASRSPGPRTSPEEATISLPYSIACTTWAIPWARRSTCATRSLPTERG